MATHRAASTVKAGGAGRYRAAELRMSGKGILFVHDTHTDDLGAGELRERL